MKSTTLIYQKVSAISLCLLATIAVTTTFMYLKALMVPFVLSLFLYFMLTPMVEGLQKKLKIPKPLASLMTIIIGIIFATLLIMVISSSVKDFASNIEIYKDRIADIIEFLVDGLQTLGYQIDKEQLRGQIKASQVFNFVGQFTNQFMGIIGNITLIFVYLIFLLPSRQKTEQKNKILSAVTQKISSYVWTKLGTSLLTGALTAIVLALIGIELALMFGVLAFLLNFIPSVGSLIAVLLPLPMALLQFGFGWQFSLILILPGSIQFLVGNILEPKLMGRSLDLHSVTLLFFLLFWGVVWGLPGMFLAVPITAIIKFILEQFPSTQFISEILAGRLPKKISD